MGIKQYSVAIIGCGSIGALKPDKYDSPETDNVLTWGHAFYNHPQFSEIVFIDIDRTKAEQAAKKWGGTSHTRLPLTLQTFKPDIIVVALNTEKHFQTFLDITKIDNYKPKVVIAEKPFTNSTYQAQVISELYQRLEIPLIVNYHRRFVTSILEFKNKIDYNLCIPVYNCILYYTRGLKRDGSHGIDLMRFFFGDYLEGKILDTKPPLIDYHETDPTYTVHMSFEKCHNIFLCPIDGREYDLFEFDITTKEGRFKFVDHSQYYQFHERIPEPTYGNYDTLNFIPKVTQKTKLTSTLSRVVQTAVNHIEKGITNPSTSKNAIEVHRIMDDLLLKRIDNK